MLDSREVSVAIWLSVFLAWAFSKAEVRRASLGVVKAALAWKIVLCVSLMAAYITLVVFGLGAVGLWDATQLKATVLWALTAALVMVFEIGSIPDDEHYFRKALRDGFKISVVLEFIVNLYVFNLAIELVLVPVATVLACMLVIAEFRDEFKPARSFLNVILAMLGLTLLAYSGYRVYTDFAAFAQASTIAEFLLPILLTALFLPFLYLLAALVSYENLFVRLQFFMNDPDLRRFAKIQLLRRFGLNYRGLNRWAKRLVHERPTTRDEVLASLRSPVASK